MPRGRIYVAILVTLLAILVIKSAIVKPAINTTLDKPAAATEAASTSPDRRAAPEMSLALETGKPGVPLSALKGKVIILDFWATWCGPCRQSIPDLQKLYVKYHSQGLEVVGISVDGSPAPVPEAVKQLGMTYPVVMANDIPDIRTKFQFSGIPQLYVVDRKGRIAGELAGYDPSRDIEPAIKKLLEE